jgi:hypothetical protein
LKTFSSIDEPSDSLNGIKGDETGGTHNINWELGKGK